MGLQLTLVGIYLGFIFKHDSILINFLWVTIMILAGCFTIIKRSELKQKIFFLPVLLGVLANVIINFAVFILIIIGDTKFFSARYLIPITGMVIGNSITTSIVGLRSFYQSLSRDEDRYRFYLMSGATKNEALLSFFSEAMKDAFNPTIASTATIGLIWLPGMMTGQILGGSDPSIAIKYQIMIMVAVFVGGVVTVFISLMTSKRFAFDDYAKFDRRIYSEKKQKKNGK
jgi:putative ABC transport system permease protein